MDRANPQRVVPGSTTTVVVAVGRFEEVLSNCVIGTAATTASASQASATTALPRAVSREPRRSGANE
jgi:hypothetical protein